MTYHRGFSKSTRFPLCFGPKIPTKLKIRIIGENSGKNSEKSRNLGIYVYMKKNISNSMSKRCFKQKLQQLQFIRSLYGQVPLQVASNNDQ